MYHKKYQKKKLGAIIFARCSSKRLPNKVLRKINKKPVLWYIVERTKQVRNISNRNIVIATSEEKSDDKIEKFCHEHHLICFRGNLNNVALRAINCCEKYNFNFFLRICADRPFLNFELFNRMISKKFYNYDLITNNLVKSYPKGQTCEIINFDTFKLNYKNFKSKKNREHICNYFYINKKKFKIKNFKSNLNKDMQKLNLSLDTISDFIKIKKIYKYFKFKKNISTDYVIKKYRELT